MLFNQAKAEYKIGEMVDVFLYVDKSKRVAATAETPIITTGESAFLEVQSTSNELGVFLNNNIVKDVLLSKNDLPKSPKQWPKAGDKMLVRLEATYTNLIAKPVSYSNVGDMMKPAKGLDIKEEVIGHVIFVGQSGINVASLDGHSIFIYKTNMRGEYHLGQEVTVSITHCKNKYDYNGTMIIDKLSAIKDDSGIVLEYMQENGGRMNFNSKTDAKVILEIFEMSKGSFKKAISNLYRERIVDQDEDGWFIK
jgi:predicted RNA-binding protein (virulence factor B family)